MACGEVRSVTRGSIVVRKPWLVGLRLASLSGLCITTRMTSISIVPSTQPITVLGQTAKFVAIGEYTGVLPASQDLTTQVTWASSAPGVATVNASGIATAVSAGTATITATSQSPSYGAVLGTANITVSSSNPTILISFSLIPLSQLVFSHAKPPQPI